jgi:catechol 2,3-dioxygenase-like lactoylglutathione lyase family enzyme
MTPPHLGLKTVLRCANFDRSRDFYTRVPGFTVIEEWSEPQGRGCILSPFGAAGPSYLEVYQMTEEDPRFDESYARPLNSDKIDLQLRTASLEAWMERLRGVWEFTGPDDLPWGQRWLRLRDPDALLIAIYQEKSR